ncbi:DNA repair protein XRCC2 [Anguilla anguilla]|uniref:DNA repair protein XRCC2 n=1 Tax=Anguilla anguilla TaxID=7936 RepID=UPI0015B01910|nr:DNA repair protein XRCC2 [Anguilla anguilla]
MSHRHSSSAESGAQLLARLEGRRSLENIEPRIFPEDSGPVKGDVVEFHGGEGTGKTEALYHLVARCILPEANGGLEAEVVFVDTDYHLDTLRLVAVLERRLPSGAEDAVRASLARLYVVHCSSGVQLLLTLHYLEGMFCSRPSLSALILDSISAFYWVDRASGGESLALQESNLRKCTRVLERLLKDTGIVVFATTHAVMRNYASEDSSSSSSSHRRWSSAHTDLSKAYLCRAWQGIVTHRLYFSKGDASDGKRVFSVTSSCLRTKSTRRCSFHVTDGGIQFL